MSCKLVCVKSLRECRSMIMSVLLLTFCSMLSSAAKDPHPRVRYEFLQCLGQMSADLEVSLEMSFYFVVSTTQALF